MKKDIHPAYKQAEVNCACGNSFKVGATKDSLTVEICSKCHPFYVGGSRLVDTAGRVEKFKQRFARQNFAKQNLGGFAKKAEVSKSPKKTRVKK